MRFFGFAQISKKSLYKCNRFSLYTRNMFRKLYSPDQKTARTEAESISKTLNGVLDRQQVQDDIVQKAVDITKRFIADQGAVLYGGTAINYLLPPEARFYDEETDVPDFDAYLVHAKSKTKELGNLFHAAGLPSVHAKSALNPGTYKLSVDYVCLVDFTEVPQSVYDKLKQEAIEIHDGPTRMLVASPDWLRMSMYKELMQPMGEPSRWPKIAPRLALLNRYRPFENPPDCECIVDSGRTHENPAELRAVINAIANYVSERKLVLFGATAMNSFINSSKTYGFFYKDDFPMRVTGLSHVSDFDVFTVDLERDVRGLQQALRNAGVEESRIEVLEVDEVNGLIPKRSKVMVDDEVLIELYENKLCVGYLDGVIESNDGHEYRVRVASLPSMIKMWFTWLYAAPDDVSTQQRCKVVCGIEFLLNHQSYFVDSPFSIFSKQCEGNVTTKRQLLGTKKTWNWKAK